MKGRIRRDNVEGNRKYEREEYGGASHCLISIFWNFYEGFTNIGSVS